MSLKDFPGYTFHEFSRIPLRRFLYRAESRNNDDRNLEDLKLVTEKLPPKFATFNEVLDRKEKGEEKTLLQCNSLHGQKYVFLQSPKKEEPESSVSPLEMTPHIDAEYLGALIIENLERGICLPADEFNQLKSLNEEQATVLFAKLFGCSTRDIIIFGESLLRMCCSDDVILIQFFAEKLLINKANQVYNSSFEKVFKNFMDLYPNFGKKAVLKKITCNEEEDLGVISQYISNISPDHKTNILRDFLHEIERLQEKQFSFLEVLLSDQLDFDLLKKLVEIMCNNADLFSNDKGFGKLLTTVIQKLGTNATKLEQLLKYIIGCHKSIWRIKAKKVFDSYFSDSLLLTQSVRF